MDKESIKKSINVIGDAISVCLHSAKCAEDGRAELINTEWLMRVCTELNDIKLDLEGEL